jgi:hypothetical protein
MMNFTPTEKRLLTALAEVAIPRGDFIRMGDERTTQKVCEYFSEAGDVATAGYRAMLGSLQALAYTRYLRPLTSLSAEERGRFLRRLEELPGGYTKQLVRLLLTPIKTAHIRDEEIYQKLQVPFHNPVPNEPNPRYFSQVIDGSTLTESEEIEADVVVIGSGAGGAVVAKELSQQGAAVVILEEGRYFTRNDFRADTMAMLTKLYRDHGMISTLGSPIIPLPVGLTVGGSTTVNSGTCLRAKSSLFRRWREQDGLSDLSEDTMLSYYDRVETFLGVKHNGAYTGQLGGVIAQGCEALGITHHGPLPRNAPDCDGQGLCCFGCPTDAKKSANVSWIPAALKSGAMLYSRVFAQTLLQEKGRAVGVVARAGTKENPVKLTVRAKIVVLAGGTVMSPLFLEQNRLGGRSGQLGRNLTIHPALGVAALFRDRKISGWNAVPQGYGIEEFIDEGILFEGAFGRPDILALNFPTYGREFTELVERYHELAIFGFMIADSAKGRVYSAQDGRRPLITYELTKTDVERFKRGCEILGRIFFAAGAESIILPISGDARAHSTPELVAFRGRNIPAWAFEVSAYHPLGTCKMGPDPRTSVVSSSHELHDLPNCFVVDGSTVNGPLGVNPQLTIMAMATRASEKILERLSLL